MAGVEQITVEAGEAGMRLDRWFKTHYARLPHSRLEKLLRTGQVRVDGGRAKASTRLAAGQSVRVPPLPDVAFPPGEKRTLSKADRNFLKEITLYEDDDLLILNKPSGVAVQGGTKTTRHIDRLLESVGDGPETRPRLVHRLDRDTSGVLVIAKPSRRVRYGRSTGHWFMGCRSRRKARSMRRWSRRRRRTATGCGKRAPASKKRLSPP